METEFVPEAFALEGEELGDTTALMFGRRSYEVFAPAWRDSEDHAAYSVSYGSGSPRATRTG